MISREEFLKMEPQLAFIAYQNEEEGKRNAIDAQHAAEATVAGHVEDKKTLQARIDELEKIVKTPDALKDAQRAAAIKEATDAKERAEKALANLGV